MANTNKFILFVVIKYKN